MVDPINFTNYNRTDVELEECAIFSVLVAGKNALTTAKCTDKFLQWAHQHMGWKTFRPFACLKNFSTPEISDALYKNGIGCHRSKGRSLYELVNSGIDLRICTTDDLEKIHGIGPKTSRMFILHNRKDVQLAVLDVHILRYMADCGYDVPATTPSKGQYKKIEKQFLELAKQSGKSVAEFDLELWRLYRNKRRKAS